MSEEAILRRQLLEARERIRILSDDNESLRLAVAAARRGLPMAVSWPLAMTSAPRVNGGDTDELCREQFVRGWNSCLSACQFAVANRGTVQWPNGSNRTVPQALRFLARNPRPAGGQEAFNAEHLYQLAAEIEQLASKTLV
jgi:hypothetical protein